MRFLFMCPLFLLIAYLLYQPSMGGEFIMDDWGYITSNAWITQTSTPFHFWTSFHQPDFWPLSYTFYWIFYRLFGTGPLPYHMVNVVLHAVNALLVHRLASQFGLNRPLWAALLFLVHPLHVQAVSWIVQFKTLLCTSLTLACLLFYIRFLRGDWLADWGRAWICYALALLAKASAVFLPAVLFALPRATGKLGKIPALRYLIPFFVLAVAAAWTTVHVNEMNFTDRSAPVFQIPATERPWLAARNLVFYISKFAVPYPLAFIYPLKVTDPSDPSLWFVAAVLLAGALCLLHPRLREARLPVLFYVFALAPALGFVPIPGMKLSLVADHWAYLPDAFLAIAAGTLLSAVGSEAVHRACYFLLLPLAYLTYVHAADFASEEGFWLKAREINPGNAAVAYNLGTVYDKKERGTEAMREFKAAIKLDPKHDRAWYNLGRHYFLRRDFLDAESCFDQVLRLSPGFARGYTALAALYSARGQPDRARAVLEQGLSVLPDNPEILAALTAR